MHRKILTSLKTFIFEMSCVSDEKTDEKQTEITPYKNLAFIN